MSTNKALVHLIEGVIILGFSLILTGCGHRDDILTVDGPESTRLISKIQGYIIHPIIHRGDSYGARIRVVSLPQLQEATITIVPAKKKFKFIDFIVHTISGGQQGFEFIYYLSGPDENGRIVYMKSFERGFNSRYDLVLTSVQGKEHEIIFSKSGNILNEIGVVRPLALAPQEGHLALINRITGKTSMEIWDIINKKKIVELSASSSGMSWFPDGKRIAYCKYIHKKEIPDFDSYPEEFGKKYSLWPAVPAVFIYDLYSGTDEFFHTGHYPVVSFDGKSIVISDALDNGHLIDIETKKTKAIEWPDRYAKNFASQIIAFPGPNTVLYWGLPTKGTTPQWTKGNSPFIGQKLMPSIKVLDSLTGEFQTIIKAIDPRKDVSYGYVQ